MQKNDVVVLFKPKAKKPTELSPEAQQEAIVGLKKTARYHHQRSQALTREKTDLEAKVKKRDEFVEKLSSSAHLLEITLFNKEKKLKEHILFRLKAITKSLF